MEAAPTPIVMAIVSLSSSLVAPNLSAFLMWPSRHPLQCVAREAAIAISSLVFLSSAEDAVGLLVKLEVNLPHFGIDHGVGRPFLFLNF